MQIKYFKQDYRLTVTDVLDYIYTPGTRSLRRHDWSTSVVYGDITSGLKHGTQFTICLIRYVLRD